MHFPGTEVAQVENVKLTQILTKMLIDLIRTIACLATLTFIIKG